MAFELTDFYRTYVPRGEYRGLFNLVRSDESSTSPRYYGWMNEAGSYVIQKAVLTSGVGVYTYYGSARQPGSLSADWANRASLSYVEYYLLFDQTHE